MDRIDMKPDLKTLLVGVPILAGLYLTSLYDFLLFHSLAEIFSVVVAMGIFMIFWNTREISHSTFFHLLGVAYLFVGGLDLLHTLAYKGTGIFPGYGADLPTQLWIGARYLESLSLLAASLLMDRRILHRDLLAVYGLITGLLLVLIFGGIFPTCFIEGVGLTPFKKISEYLICLILIGAAAGMIRVQDRFDPDVYRLTLASILFTIASELLFTFYISVYGISNLIGHFFKIISFYLIYKAVIETGLARPYQLLFREVKQSERQYRLLAENVEDVIWVMKQSMDGYTYISPSVEGMLGYWPEEMLDKPFAEYIAEPHLSRLEKQGRRRLNLEKNGHEDNLTRRWEVEYIRSDGERIWVESVTRPFRGENGEFLGIIGVTRDITHRKNAERELRMVNQAWQNTFDAVPDMILILDNNFRIVNANRAAAVLLNCSIDDLEGQFCYRMVHCQDSPVPDCPHALSVKDGLTHITERWDSHMNGQFLVSASPIKDETGKCIGGVHVARDISDVKKVEEELEQAKEAAESANRIKSEFLASMSHELRTPLNGILGYTQILMRNHAGLTEHQKMAVQTIQRSGEYLLSMINDVLDLSKIEANRLELRPIDFHLKNLLADIIRIIEIRTAEKDLDFQRKIDQNLPERIYGDEKRLHQVLLNLLTNACKYTSSGFIRFTAEFRTGAIRFRVEDSGEGIPQEKLEEIFLPFHQLRNRRFQTEGTGLGLAISRKIVRAMGGELYVSSTPEQGSAFWFDMEVPQIFDSSALFPEQDLGAVIGYEGEEKRVLVADDIPYNRSLLVDFLTPLGFHVREAADGIEAMTLLKDFIPHLILLDIVMPHMNGFEVIRKIHQEYPELDCPIIAVSASPTKKEFETNRELGFSDFIFKPVRFEELLAKIGEHLGIQWRYQKVPDPVSSSIDEDLQLHPPRSEDIQALKRMADIGDIRGIQRHAEEMVFRNSESSAFAGRIISHAKAFELNEIICLIEHFSEDRNESGK